MTTTCLMLWLALAAGDRGQASAPRPQSPVLAATGAFLAVSVTDLEASVRWYSETLGLTVVMGAPKRDGIAFAVLEGGGVIVEMVQRDTATPARGPGSGPVTDGSVLGVFKAGVIVEDFDKLLASFKARNVAIAYGPYAAKEGRRANLIIEDNSGNLIQFFGK